MATEPDNVQKEGKKYSPPVRVALALGVFLCLWLFFCGLGIMGSSFAVLGGKDSGNMFHWITDPVVGLMIGVLTTVLVQSSSTSTSIVVGLVASGMMNVATAIPVIMGANIGTSVTNTLVSLGQMNDKEEFRRAFAGATVHDMFNYLTVLVLLPVEIITSAMNGGDGGLLFAISDGMTSGLATAEGGKFDSPIKLITKPITGAFVSVDKDKIKALSMGMPTLTTCIGKVADVGTDKEKMVAKIPYTICGNATQLAKATQKWNERIVEGSLIKGGAFEGTADGLAGVLLLIISLIILCGGLYGIVKCLKALVLSGNQELWSKVLNYNGYVSILVGTGLTIAVQSSSIVTSALVPLVGIGTLTLEGMLPLTLGANIGTTCTALLAAIEAGKKDGLQIAICHLMFNILGILIFYPAPVLRNIPLNAARFLGYMTICYRAFPFVYIAVAFFIVPLFVIALGQMMAAGAGGMAVGVIISLFLSVAGIAAIYMWKKKGYRERVMAHLDKLYEEREMDAPEGKAVAPKVEMTDMPEQAPLAEEAPPVAEEAP